MSLIVSFLSSLTELPVRKPPSRLRTTSVSQDWRVDLPQPQGELYARVVRELETAYQIFSVNLDEALGLQRRGRPFYACQTISMSAPLCERLTSPLWGLVNAMLLHAKHFGTTPNLAPLDPANFQSPRSQRIARMNMLFSGVLLSQRSQFIYKLSSLAQLIEELESDFVRHVQVLSEGTSPNAGKNWEPLDAVHFDINTSFREANVLLKCFLHALPEEQLGLFEANLASKRPKVAAKTASAAVVRRAAEKRVTVSKSR